MRIFLDVGAHYGEILDVALAPRWGFDRLYSFEPARGCQRILRGFRDSRVQVVPAGLSNRDGQVTLYGGGRIGASVYADKPRAEPALAPETIPLLRATDWLLASTRAADEVYLKLNCEGSECDVLEDLLDGGAVDRIRSVYVDFDVRKIPSQAHRQEPVERRLREAGCHYVTPEDLTSPAGGAAVREWLGQVLPDSAPRGGAGAPRYRLGRAEALRYRLGLHRPPYLLATSVARRALPAPAFAFAARYLGAQSRTSARRRACG